VRNLREGDHLEDLDVDGRIILKRIFKKWDGAWTGIHLARNRGRWHVLVNVVMNFQVLCFLLGDSPASEFRRRGITQKEAYNIQYTAKV